MSLESSAWAWKQKIKRSSRTSRPAVKVVLMALANLVDHSHRCSPSIARLMRDTELSRQTILSAIKYLQQIDLIKVPGTMKDGNRVYQLMSIIEERGNA